MQGIKCLKGCGASIEDIQEYCRLCLQEESEEKSAGAVWNYPEAADRSL